MRTYEELKTVVEGWLRELLPYSHMGSKNEVLRFEQQGESEGRVVICTAMSTYSIRFREYDVGGPTLRTYLGCVASCRIARAGEDWLRGSDLPDGDFTRLTWDSIVRAILGYELVALEPVPQFVADKLRVPDAYSEHPDGCPEPEEG